MSAVERRVSQIVAILSDRDLRAVTAFCAIGILLTFNIVLRFPDFGTQVASLVTFP
jgi:esterase/lipase superfamily enzyme